MKYAAGMVFWVCMTALGVTHMVIQHLQNKHCIDRGGSVDNNWILQDGCKK